MLLSGVFPQIPEMGLTHKKTGMAVSADTQHPPAVTIPDIFQPDKEIPDHLRWLQKYQNSYRKCSSRNHLEQKLPETDVNSDKPVSFHPPALQTDSARKKFRMQLYFSHLLQSRNNSSAYSSERDNNSTSDPNPAGTYQRNRSAFPFHLTAAAV